jgi:hypothetical protein
MVDRRVRYLNPNPKFPAPGGGAQLLDGFKAPALSDIQRERLPAPVALEQPSVVATAKDAPVTDSKHTTDPAKAVPEISSELGAWMAAQKETPLLEQSERLDPISFAAGARHKGAASNLGGVVLTFERVEALQAARADSRDKTANALRQLAESVSSGGMPWEIFQVDYDEKADPGIRSRPSKPLGGSKEISLSHTDQSGQVAEIVVPLAEGIVRGRSLVACPGWVLLMLLFLAATSLALIAEQGFLNAGMFMHFLESKAWTFIKLGLIFAAALAALRGLFFSLFSNPLRNGLPQPNGR